MSKAYQSLLKSLPANNSGASSSNSSVGSLTEKYKQLLQETTAEHLGKFNEDGEDSDDDVNEEQEEDTLEGEEDDEMLGFEGDEDMMDIEGEEDEELMGLEGEEGDDLTLTAEDEEAMKLYDEDDGTFEDDTYNKANQDIIEDSELSSDEEEALKAAAGNKRKRGDVISKSSFVGMPYDLHFNSNLTNSEHNQLQSLSMFLPVSSADTGLRVKPKATMQRVLKSENAIAFASTASDKYNRTTEEADEDDTSVLAQLSDVQKTSREFLITSDRLVLKKDTLPDYNPKNFEKSGVRPRLAKYWQDTAKMAVEMYETMKEFYLNMKPESQAMVEKTKNEALRKLGKQLQKKSKTFEHPLQEYLAPLVYQYKDVYFANPNPCIPLVEYGVIQDLYLSHVVNHIFTSKDIQVSHNESLSRKAAKEREQSILTRAENLDESEKRALLLEREKVLLHGDKSAEDMASLQLIQRELKETSNKSKKNLRMKNRKMDDEKLQKEIQSMHAATSLLDTVDTNEKYRDQGFTRPKVLILTPNKSCAYQLILRLLEFLPEKNKKKVLNIARLHEQFGDIDEENVPKQFKPLDHRLAFLGDDDDCFKVGMSFSNSEVKLFSKFYASDIIIGSPLGVKLLAGNEGDDDNDRKTDFLTSIEVCILDQAERFTMQNLDHVHDVLQSMNTLPKQNLGIDFTRVRPWYLDGQARFYRQTLIFSSYMTSGLNTLFQKYCENKAGRFRIRPIDYSSIVHRVRPKVKHIFMRLDEVKEGVNAAEERFRVFEHEMWPKIKDAYKEGQVLFFVPSYYDYVRVRNFLKARFARFGILSEYTDPRMIGVVRTNFFKGLYQFALMSERFHHFNRISIKAVKHVVWYGLPDHPSYYYELLNNIDGTGKSADIVKQSTSFVMYTKQDAMNLEKIVGSDMSADMLTSRQHIHMITPK